MADSFGDTTTGTIPGQNTVVLGSLASTRVNERPRMMESNIIIEDVDLSDECLGCAQTSNRERSYIVLKGMEGQSVA